MAAGVEKSDKPSMGVQRQVVPDALGRPRVSDLERAPSADEQKVVTDSPVTPLYHGPAFVIDVKAIPAEISVGGGSQVQALRSSKNIAEGRLDRDKFGCHLMEWVGSSDENRCAAKQNEVLKSLLCTIKDPNDPKSAEDLAWAAAKIRRTLAGRSSQSEGLSRFFDAQGIALWRTDTASVDCGRQLHRASFSQKLRGLSGRELKRRDMFAVWDLTSKLVDKRDIFWAKSQIERAAAADKISKSDATTLINGLPKIAMQVSRYDVVDAVRSLANSDFSNPRAVAVAESRLTTLLNGCDDAGTLGLARDYLNSRLRVQKKKNGDAAAQTELKQVQARFDRYFSERMQGKFDRRSELRKLRALQNDGALSFEQSNVLLAAAYLSSTPDEYRAACAFAQKLYPLNLVQLFLLEIWEQMEEAREEQKRDEEKRTEERAGEEKRFEIQRAELNQSEIRMYIKRLGERAKAWSDQRRGDVATILVAYSQSRTPEEKSTHLASLARALSEADSGVAKSK